MASEILVSPNFPVAGGSTWLRSGQFSLVKVYWVVLETLFLIKADRYTN